MQALAQKGFNVAYLSVDRTVEPYYALRDAIYEGRIRFYNYKAFSISSSFGLTAVPGSSIS